MRPLRTATVFLFSAFPVFAGTVVEVKPVEVKVGGPSASVSPLPILQLSQPSLVAGLTPSPGVLAAVPALASPAAVVPIAAVASLEAGVAKLTPKKGEAVTTEKRQDALAGLYDNGSAASSPDDAQSASPGSGPGFLAPSVPVAAAPARGPPSVQSLSKRTSRFPVLRGEIGWKEFFRLVNPGSRENTVRAPFKTSREHELESRMYDQNLGYAFGFRERTWEKQQTVLRLEKRARELAETSAKVREAYGLPAFLPNAPPRVELGTKLGEGGQGIAYRRVGNPGRVVKTFRGATGEQLQEMAAILGAVADQGFAVERVTVVRVDGGYGLEMRELLRETGWSNLATYTRVRRGTPEALRAEEAAEKILHAVGRESKRTLGFDAADWKAGFGGVISDDHLENFVIHAETGEISCFDCLVKW